LADPALSVIHAGVEQERIVHLNQASQSGELPPASALKILSGQANS
jgi:hypothetical protein